MTAFREVRSLQPALLLNWVDYEAVGESSPRGHFFSSVTHRCQSPRSELPTVGVASPALPTRTEKMASGGPGGGNEPPGRCTEAAKSWHGGRLGALPHPWPLSWLLRVRAVVSPWVALDYASCGVAAGRLSSQEDRQPGSDD